jgi:[CysO sulfur-carrier protein]-S-L-cysteine hydrolase
MIAHCRHELPHEGCGLLSGKNGIAESIWPMENMNRSAISFSMNLNQIEKVFELMNKRNESLVGIYHSHPTAEAYPSPQDIAYNNYPEVAHFIISFARSANQPVVNCFQLKGNRVNSLTIKKIQK